MGSRIGLARDHLVQAALELLEEGGIAALSTRRLAERLHVQSPALYWHVRNKDELLGLVADAICARMATPPSGLAPRARLERIAVEYRRVLMGHRDAPRLFAEQVPTGPCRMLLYEAAVSAFRDAGMPPGEAVSMASFFRHFLLGMILEEARQAHPPRLGAPSPTLALGIELSQLGDAATAYPNLREAAGTLAALKPDDLFRMGLDVLLDGMELRFLRAERT
jgi:TetR/AcrR family transcriptional regulator, tetracycline repressor protein